MAVTAVELALPMVTPVLSTDNRPSTDGSIVPLLLRVELVPLSATAVPPSKPAVICVPAATLTVRLLVPLVKLLLVIDSPVQVTVAPAAGTAGVHAPQASIGAATPTARTTRLGTLRRVAPDLRRRRTSSCVTTQLPIAAFQTSANARFILFPLYRRAETHAHTHALSNSRKLIYCRVGLKQLKLRPLLLSCG
ncbi:hypothetical protein GGR60_000297 [Xanthomonas arboricola]|nr:hypothetical protein [Xanthomonas euroxanthea]